MKSEEFFEQLDALVKRRAHTIPDSDIDIESLHLVDKARKKFQSRGNIVAIVIFILLLLAAGVALFFLFPDVQKKLGFVNVSEIEKGQGENKRQIERLTTENNGLRQNVDSLQQQIETIQTTPVPGKESAGNEPESELGADGVIRHVVNHGETLYRLAKKYYGDGMMYKTLQEDNKLNAPEDLAEGMTLKIYPEKRQQ